MASASVFVMELDKKIYDLNTSPMQKHINIGFTSDMTILDFAHLIAKVVGHPGAISFDPSRSEGAFRKWLSSEILFGMGWSSEINPDTGLELTCQSFYQANI